MREYLTIGPLPAKFDRTYRAGNVTLNLARLECSCDDWTARRAAFPADDARRVCGHLYDKLYATKAERAFDAPLQLFIRYGRTMWTYQIVDDAFGTLVIGQPWPGSVRALGVVEGKPLLATYQLAEEDWAGSETPMTAEVAARVLERLRAACPDAFR